MAWYKRLANLLRSDHHARDIDREIAFHLAERADELAASGLSREEARYQARRRFGNRGLLKERTREADVLVWLESIAGDVRYALRSLRASPGLASAVILSLGLGIGANTAIFSLIDAVMLRSLPVARPRELHQVVMVDRGEEFTNPIWEALRARQDVFSGVFAFGGRDFDLGTGGPKRRANGTWVSGDYFRTLGVGPAAGRLFVPDDDVRGCPATAVLGYGFWQSEYGGDAGIVGRSISLDGQPFTIIGVSASGFSGVEVGRSVQIYIPLCTVELLEGAGALDAPLTWYLQIIGRPKPGVTTDALRERLAALSPGIFAATEPNVGDSDLRKGYLATRLDAQPAASGLSALRARYRGALLTLMAAVAVVLVVACLNVANLLLARATARGREMAVRLAIGASRGRIVRQLLTESVLLALLGATVGLLFARWGSAMLVRFLSSRSNAVWLDLAVDGRMLAFTTVVAAATGILFGLAPAWRAARTGAHAAMQAGARVIVEGHGRRSSMRALVVGQMALSLVLVIAGALLLRTFHTLAKLDPGFASEGVLLVNTDFGRREISAERLLVVRRELLERLRALPGVTLASASQLTPLSGNRWNGPIGVDGREPGEDREATAFYNEVTDGYFATMRTPLVSGRDFGSADGPGAPRVAIINEAMARRFFGNADPIGRRFTAGVGPEQAPELHVIGVVKDAKYASLREAPRPTVYFAMSQSMGAWSGASFELRADSPSTVIPLVTAAVAQVDPTISLDFRMLEEQVSATLTRERLLAALAGFFGGLALLLAIIGLYGTLSYSIARRRAEIGIRMALGAGPAVVLRMVLGQAGRMVALGVVLGILAALAATRLVAGFLFGVAPSDPATLALCAIVLIVAALSAAAVPAFRASRTDPMSALRVD